MWLSEKVALRSKTEERTRQVAFAARAHHNEVPSGPERGLASSCGATKAVDTPAEPKTPQKSSPAASQGARAAQDATDAAPDTPTQRRQPALVRWWSSQRVGAGLMPRRPARDRWTRPIPDAAAPLPLALAPRGTIARKRRGDEAAAGAEDASEDAPPSSWKRSRSSRRRIRREAPARA